MKRSAQINAGGARTGFYHPQHPQNRNQAVPHDKKLAGVSPFNTRKVPAEHPQIAHQHPQTSLECLVNHTLEHGSQFGDGVRMVVNVPVRTSVGTIIEGVTDRYNLDAFDGMVWVHSNQARTTYAAAEMDAARWLHVLEVKP